MTSHLIGRVPIEVVSLSTVVNNRRLLSPFPGGRMRVIGFALLSMSVAVTGLGAQGHSHVSRVTAELEGVHEVPAVLSPAAEGAFTATIDDKAETIHYELEFAGLQSPITQSHIHIAQEDVNGAIVIWLCQTPQAPDTVNPNTQRCPSDGTITGTIVPSDVRTVATQGLPATLSASEKFARVVAAIREGVAYANIHTVQSPGGEIRGQIQVKSGKHDNDDHGDHD
jgi:hypothetical protein